MGSDSECAGILCTWQVQLPAAKSMSLVFSLEEGEGPKGPKKAEKTSESSADAKARPLQGT